MTSSSIMKVWLNEHRAIWDKPIESSKSPADVPETVWHTEVLKEGIRAIVADVEKRPLNQSSLKSSESFVQEHIEEDNFRATHLPIPFLNPLFFIDAPKDVAKEIACIPSKPTVSHPLHQQALVPDHSNKRHISTGPPNTLPHPPAKRLCPSNEGPPSPQRLPPTLRPPPSSAFSLGPHQSTTILNTNKRDTEDFGFSTAAAELDERAREGNPDALRASKAIREAASDKSNLKPFVKKALEGNDSASASTSHATMGAEEDLDPRLEPYRSLLEGEISKEILSVVVNMKLTTTDVAITRDDIAGLNDLKKVIDRRILWPMRRPDFNTGLNRAPRGVLLFGPPGTGKTTIARWIASEGCASFFDVSPSSLMSKYVGETETIIKALFKVAAFDSPSVLFLDEIDAVLGKRKDSNDESTVRMKNQILQAMEGFSTQDDQLRIIIGATNRPDSLDEAALRRFQKRILVPLPDPEARISMLTKLLEKNDNGCKISVADLNEIATNTDGWNCSDIRNLAEKATDFRLDELEKEYCGIENIPAGLVPRRLVMNDFRNALQHTRSTNDPDDLQRFHTWASKHAAI